MFRVFKGCTQETVKLFSSTGTDMAVRSKSGFDWLSRYSETANIPKFYSVCRCLIPLICCPLYAELKVC